MPESLDLDALREAREWIDGISDPLWPVLTESDWAQLMGRVLSLVDDLRAENERLREAVVRFGHHHEWCAYRHDGTTCGCGLHAALAGSPAANEEQQ